MLLRAKHPPNKQRQPDQHLSALHLHPLLDMVFKLTDIPYERAEIPAPFYPGEP